MTAAALGAPAPDPGAGEVVQTEHSGDFLRLTRLWQHRTHFSLLFAAFDNPAYRDGLIQRLNAVQPGLRMELAANDTPQDWLAQLQAGTHAGEKRVHTLLPARGPEDTARWWQQANVLRERLADAFPATILVWLSDADIDTAAHQAPDLWNWREAVFTFTHAVPVNLPDLSSERFSPVSGPDAQSVQQRLADIECYLQQADTDPLAAGHLQLEAAQAHQRLGQWSQSETAARAAARAFQLAGNAQMAAQAQGQIADILQLRGQFDEAQRIRYQEELPVYERLGDVRSKAITMGQIADVLQLRGQFDEALRIRYQEELPVYESLGDVHSKAISMGKIAEVLQSRGQLDEAIRIRFQQQIPVFERQGDVRSKAVTMGKVADILQLRGQYDEALRIRRQMELPVYERLGDVREKAVTMGKIADILQSRGQLDEALRIRQEEQLPVFEHLGDLHSKAVTLGQIADIFQVRGQLEEALTIWQTDCLPVFERLGLNQETVIANARVMELQALVREKRS